MYGEEREEGRKELSSGQPKVMSSAAKRKQPHG